MTITNETLQNLANDLKMSDEQLGAQLHVLGSKENRYIKDLRINISNAFNYTSLTKKESYLLALAVAINDKSSILIDNFKAQAIEYGAIEDDIIETVSCVSLLNINNVFYRFRHFTKKEAYNSPAGIKMSVMGNPVMGKEFFELMSLAVSALNGCEMCVASHEDSLVKLGTSEIRIYEAIKLTAIVRGLTAINFN
jgi:alkyl hydroperoxide reductase subunit D